MEGITGGWKNVCSKTLRNDHCSDINVGTMKSSGMRSEGNAYEACHEAIKLK